MVDFPPASAGDEAADAILQSVGGGRPIMPDVWAAYRQQPGEAQDLLLTPHSEARAGQLAQELRTALDACGPSDADQNGRPSPICRASSRRCSISRNSFG